MRHRISELRLEAKDEQVKWGELETNVSEEAQGKLVTKILHAYANAYINSITGRIETAEEL